MKKLLYGGGVALILCACRGGGGDVSPLLAIILSDTGRNPYDPHLDSAPDDGCVRLRSNVRVPLSRLFNDSNHVHLLQARAGGIRPIED